MLVIIVKLVISCGVSNAILESVACFKIYTSQNRDCTMISLGHCMHHQLLIGHETVQGGFCWLVCYSVVFAKSKLTVAFFCRSASL